MTNRLRELETELKARQGHSSWAIQDGRVRGYRMALEDLEPGLEVAQWLVVNWIDTENMHITPISTGNDIVALRDALAGLEDA